MIIVNTVYYINFILCQSFILLTFSTGDKELHPVILSGCSFFSFYLLIVYLDLVDQIDDM